MTASVSQAGFFRDVRTVLILALAPAIGLGIARFAYALILPDMRASLGWSYAEAGFMNTINAAGYLAGALGAAHAVRRFGGHQIVVLGSAACVAGLGLSAVSGDFALLSLFRLLTGIGAAVAFVAGSALAAKLSQRHPERASFVLSLFYVGPGIGIVLSGVTTPVLLDQLGPGSWWVAWGSLGALAGVLGLAPPFAQGDTAHGSAAEASRSSLDVASMLPLLFGYLAFGAGYIAYITFMIAWVRDTAAGGAFLQALFWTLIGIGAIASPWLWSGTIARLAGGRAVAVLIGVTLAGAIMPLWGILGPMALVTSALVFGSAFFAVVAATTAFVRRNLRQSSWPAGIAAMTVAFGIGQTLGPVATGAVTDLAGGLSVGLWTSTGLLALGMVAAAFQPDLPDAPRL